MNLPRPTRIIVALVLALLPFFAFAALDAAASNDRVLPIASAQIPSASSPATRIDRPYLPVIYKPTSTRPAPILSMRPAALTTMSASQIITNGEDIVYLINSGQIGRTQNFSAGNPIWTSLITDGASISGTFIYDFALDPDDPYHKAWVVGTTGIWRTANLNDSTPNWTVVSSTNQITELITSKGGIVRTTFGVTHIATDASRPGNFLRSIWRRGRSKRQRQRCVDWLDA